MNKCHGALKMVYGPRSSGATPLLSADRSTLLTDKDAIMGNWVEHFKRLFNRSSAVKKAEEMQSFQTERT